MKVLEFIQSLIVPTHMVKRKKMNILISILIFVLATYLMSVPISIYLKKTYYEAFDEKFNFNAFNFNERIYNGQRKYSLLRFGLWPCGY